VIVARLPHYEAHLKPVHDLLGDTDVTLVASYGDLVEAQRQKARRIVLMQHGIGQSYSDQNPHYPGGKGNDAVGLFLAPNEHAAGRWRAAYPRARVEVVGSPRLDDLPRRQPGPQTVAVSFHWDAYHHPESRSAFDYYRSALPELAKRFTVIGHGHPRRRDMARKWGLLGIEFVPDFDDVCRRADVYVADNTSTLYEFAATGRNVVVLNAPFYRREINHGLRFWDAAHVGINVHHPDQLALAVDYALTTSDVASREDALDIVYAYRSGGAARAVRAIREWSNVAVAA
jgi:hypothetical protein